MPGVLHVAQQEHGIYRQWTEAAGGAGEPSVGYTVQCTQAKAHLCHAHARRRMRHLFPLADDGS